MGHYGVIINTITKQYVADCDDLLKLPMGERERSIQFIDWLETEYWGFSNEEERENLIVWSDEFSPLPEGLTDVTDAVMAAYYKHINPSQEDNVNTNPNSTFKIIGQLHPDQVTTWISSFNEDLVPLLGEDVSNYAPGRKRLWLPYEAPLSASRPWEMGLWDPELWEALKGICADYDFTPDLALISKGGAIKEHRDASYADYRSIGINLGGATFCYRTVYPGMGWSKDQNQKAEVEVYRLEGGEIFEFNCKNPHWVEDVDPERWGINLWTVSGKEKARFEEFKKTNDVQEDTMNTNENRKDITLDIEVEITKEEILGKDVLEWLRTDLHALKPMRFVGMTVLETAELLNTPYPFHVKANFSSTTDITKPEFLKPWVEKTVNNNTQNYRIIVENHEFGTNNQSQEDTNMSIEKPQFTLPNDDDEFRISWRLDANSDWEPEVTRPTLNQAMHYIADAANQLGEFKIEQLVGNEVILINLNRTTQPKIHEYKLWLYDQEVQVTTNSMPEGEALAYKTYNDELNAGKQEVIAFKHQAEITAKWVLDTQHKVTKGIRVKPQFVSETWQYALIMQRIVRLGGFFRFVRIGKDELKMIDEQVINRMIENSSFAFAEGEDLTIFTVADHNYQQVAWDDFEDFIGIKIINSPKMGKRMKEITRYTLYWDTMTKPLVIHPVEFESDMEIAVDGIGAISASAFKRMIENIPIEAVRRGSYGKLANGGIRRVNFRYVYGDGLIKGDAIVVPDSVLEAQYGYVPDLVQPVVNGELINLKKELRTDGSWAIMTANPHHAHHQPMTNDQVLSIMSNHADEPWLFSEEQLKEDHLSFINDVHEDLKNGIFPKFMTAEGMFDSSNDKKDNDLLAARLQQLSVRWNMAGRSLLESAFFIRMVGNGFLNRLNKALGKKGDGEGKPGKKKIMVPIRHAAYVHVTTLSIIEMCGYDPAEEGWDTTKCFYYEPAHSWVKPDSVFIHDFARHGGEDGDDSEIVMIRNVQFPDGSVKVMAISVRMPTAWGEWSMNEVDTNGFPFYNTWNEMPTVIYADRPEFLEEMNQLVSGLPVSDVEMPAEYTAQWCMFLVELIKLNPGVGRIINPMIAYYATMHTYFPEQLASTEDFVDTLQQTPDKDAFVAINGEIERMLQLIVDSGAVIDDHIYKTRLQSVELPKDSDTTTSTDGFFTRMFRFTAACAADWEQKVRELATNRTEIPRLNELVLPETIEMVWFDGKNIVDSPTAAARFLIRNFDSDYKRYKYIPKGEARRQFSGNLTNNIVDWIMDQPEQSRHWIMVAVYQYIWKTKDRKDNFLFQTPLNAWDKSTMDVLLITLYHLGLAKIQLADGSWHYKEELKGESITEATDADLAGMVEEEGEY